MVRLSDVMIEILITAVLFFGLGRLAEVWILHRLRKPEAKHGIHSGGRKGRGGSED